MSNRQLRPAAFFFLSALALCAGCTAADKKNGAESGPITAASFEAPLPPDTLSGRLEQVIGQYFDAPLSVNPALKLCGGLQRYEGERLPILSVSLDRLDDSIPEDWPVHYYLVLEVVNHQSKVPQYEVFFERTGIHFSFSDGRKDVLDDNYLEETATGYARNGGVPVLSGESMQPGLHTVTAYLVFSDGSYVAGESYQLALYEHLVEERAPEAEFSYDGVSDSLPSGQAVTNVDPPRPAVVISPEGLRLRAGPGSGHDIISVLPDGANTLIHLRLNESFSVEGATGSWVKISSDRGNGWVFSGFLREAGGN